MASVDRIEFNDAAVIALLQSAPIQGELERRADAIAAAAGASGGKFEVTTKQGKDRTHVYITTADIEARKAEAQDRVLTRALDAGR